MKTSDFDYPLPSELIAQEPMEPRDHSRLMVLDRSSGSIEHRRFCDIVDYLREGDVLVFNDTRVIPARLKGKRLPGGGKTEILLLRRVGDGEWEALLKPGKRLRMGDEIEITGPTSSEPRLLARVTGLGKDGVKSLRFSGDERLQRLGSIPLPPYIHTPLPDPERYQTVYACPAGSVAAPTAGLHFTPELIERLKEKSVNCLFVTLHIGLDTFRPVREENPVEHAIYKEYGLLAPAVASQLSRAKSEGRRIICVGTTSVRILEQAAQVSGSHIEPFAGWVSLFILPGYRFRMMDALVTNFHLPRSTLLMLVSAFAGTDLVRQAYEAAIAERYRFYSFGDAMLIL